jgi:predicted nucleic acid-binding Zn ribbon protein
MIKWNSDELQMSISLLTSGYTYDEIGQILKRTPRSIREKLRKCGYISTSYEHIKFKEIKHCLNCGEEIYDLKSKIRLFCSNSCSTIYNNIKRKKEKHCLNCGKPVGHKFCDNTCFKKYKENKIFEQIEKNTFKLENKETEGKWIKRYLIHKYGEKCMKCSWSETNTFNNKIPIQLEHKDGDYKNNDLNNVELLCPNCHSLTPTYGALNKGHGRNERRLYRNKLRSLSIDKLLLKKIIL